MPGKALGIVMSEQTFDAITVLRGHRDNAARCDCRCDHRSPYQRYHDRSHVYHAVRLFDGGAG
jgi:hypothetical protein